MRKSYKFAKKKRTLSRYKSNYSIKSSEVNVIDETGTNIGILNTKEAIQRAKDIDMDLVEVNPNSSPPTAKIINYGSFKYKQEKAAKEQKKRQKKIEVKGIRLSSKISEHDMETRIKQTNKFLDDGHKIKIELILRGREFQHIGKAKDTITEFSKKLAHPFIIEQHISKQGNKLFMIIIPEKIAEEIKETTKTQKNPTRDTTNNVAGGQKEKKLPITDTKKVTAEKKEKEIK